MTKVMMPEPVAWITNESLYGLKTGRTNSKGAVPVHASRSYVAKTPLITTDQAEAYASAKVREALEAAAQTCEARIGTGSPGIDTGDCDDEARECAAAIRALIPK